MTKIFSFGRTEAAVARAAEAGLIEAADMLAKTMRESGERASVPSALEGTARVVLEGAGAVAREFGTRKVPPRPVLGPALQVNRGRVVETVARALAGAFKERQ